MARAALRLASNCEHDANTTSCPWRTAQWPSACARWLLPVPQGTGQRYSAFEITRRMGELERRSRRSRWASLKPSTTLRADVMFFTNSLWYARVSDEPDINARYDAWRTLHGMHDTVESLRSQTAELDEYRKERFEKMTGVLLLLFLPITMATGFFSGAQFNEMELRVGLPWTTGGWKVFLIYTAVFTVLVFGALVLARLLSWRKR